MLEEDRLIRFLRHCHILASKEKLPISGYLGVANDIATYIHTVLPVEKRELFTKRITWQALFEDYLNRVFDIENTERDDIFKKAFQKWFSIDNLDDVLLLNPRSAFARSTLGSQSQTGETNGNKQDNDNDFYNDNDNDDTDAINELNHADDDDGQVSSPLLNSGMIFGTLDGRDELRFDSDDEDPAKNDEDAKEKDADNAVIEDTDELSENVRANPTSPPKNRFSNHAFDEADDADFLLSDGKGSSSPKIIFRRRSNDMDIDDDGLIEESSGNIPARNENFNHSESKGLNMSQVSSQEAQTKESTQSGDGSNKGDIQKELLSDSYDESSGPQFGTSHQPITKGNNNHTNSESTKAVNIHQSKAKDEIKELKKESKENSGLQKIDLEDQTSSPTFQQQQEDFLRNL